MRHPLPVARAASLAHAAAVDVGEIHGEAGIPLAHPLGGGAGEIAVILDGGAEAGRAHHGAVAAGQATLGHLVPARVVQIAFEQLLDAVGLQAAAHLACGARDDGVGGRDVRLRSLPMRHLPEDIGAGFAADLDQKLVPVSLYKLRQRQIEARIGLGPSTHRNAETCAAGLAAVHCDDEGISASRFIGHVRIRAVAEHLVLNADGADLAGPHADECEFGSLALFLRDRAVVVTFARGPQRHHRRM